MTYHQLTEVHDKHTHAEGTSTKAIGKSSHAEGFATQATNTNTHAEEWGTIAKGNTSHAEGNKQLLVILLNALKESLMFLIRT